MNTDEDSGELVRLQRLLAMAGVGSRRNCEEYVVTGRVTVDGKTITELGARVNPEVQEVRLDGERIRINRRAYYMFNKPTGVLCTNRDPEGRPRVIDLFPKSQERLFTVGRLDENSQGLLLVTNDGELAHRMAHPKFRVEKTYRVQVAGIPSREIVEQLEEGMYFSDGRFAAKSARMIKSKGHSALLEIVLTEGQNREIRRLLAKVGHKVQRLTRIGMGTLRLGELPVGEFRRLTTAEVRELQDLADGKPRGAGRLKSGRGKRTGSPRAGAPRRGSRPQTAARRPASGQRSEGRGKTPRRPPRKPAPREAGFVVVRRKMAPESQSEDLPQPETFQNDRASRDPAGHSRPPRQKPAAERGRKRPAGQHPGAPPAKRRRRDEDADLPEA